jgi:hypothetical protein
MAVKPRKNEAQTAKKSVTSKKDQIIALFLSGVTEVEDLSLLTNSRPSYVGLVLQEAGLLAGCHDLYTSTTQPINVYSKYFANQLGFKDEEAAPL